MNDKTENYIILKPVAERFNKIANDITDEDIKCLILNELREQMKSVDFTHEIKSICEEWVDDNNDKIVDMFKNSIQDKFKR